MRTSIQQASHPLSPGTFAFVQHLVSTPPPPYQTTPSTVEEPPSALLVKLRSIFACSSHVDSHFPSSNTPTFHTYSSNPCGDLDSPAQEELAWLGNKVVWSKGVHVYRTFTFSRKAVVKHAFFAWFGQEEEEGKRWVPTKSEELSLNNVQFIPKSSTSTAPPPSTPLPSPKSSHRTRAVCFLFSERLEVYFTSGSSFTVHFPGIGFKAWALNIGILIETEPRLTRGGLSETNCIIEGRTWRQDPRFYVLTDPLNSVQPVWIQDPVLTSATLGIGASFPSSLLSTESVDFLHVYPNNSSSSRWPTIAIVQHGSSNRLSLYRMRSHSPFSVPSVVSPTNLPHSILPVSLSNSLPEPPTIHPPSPNTSLSFSHLQTTPSKAYPFTPAILPLNTVGKPRASPHRTTLSSSTSTPIQFEAGMQKTPLRQMTAEFAVPGERTDLNMSMDRLVLVQPGKEEAADRAVVLGGPGGMDAGRDSAVFWEFVTTWEEELLLSNSPSTLNFVFTPKGARSLSLQISNTSVHLSKSFRLSLSDNRISVELQDKALALDDLYEDCTAGGMQENVTAPCWQALKRVLSPAELCVIRRKVESASNGEKVESLAWPSFCDVLLSHLGLSMPVPSSICPLSSWDELLSSTSDLHDPTLSALSLPNTTSYDPSSSTILQAPSLHSAAKVLQALHLIAEECKLDLGKFLQLDLLGKMLVQLATGLGRRDWVDYWGRLVPQATNNLTEWNPNPYDNGLPPPHDIYIHLSSMIMNQTPLTPYPTFSSISPELLPSCSSFLRPDPTPNCTTLLAIYSVLSPTSSALSYPQRCANTVSTMLSCRFGVPELLRTPLGVATPLFEALRTCQMMPAIGLKANGYDLVGRTDLGSGKSESLKESFHSSKLVKPTITQLSEASSSTYRTRDVVSPSRGILRLGSDRRLEEVEIMLSTTRVVGLTAKHNLKEDDPEILSFQKATALNAARRTASLPIGQGMFKFSSCVASSTRFWPIPPINYSVRLFPDKVVIQQDQFMMENRDWANFHNGVAAGLRIGSFGSDINSSWIIFNRPTEHDSTHAGFLFGLGLNGHLKEFMPWHILPYLDSRHEFTVIGLLLGLASSNIGNQDSLLTKILSLHIHALLPQGAQELYASPLTQASAVLGIGMLYMGSRNRRMAEITLSEISRRSSPAWASFHDHQDAYAFSAAMAFGMVMVGRGGDAEPHGDVDLVSHLKILMFGMPSVHAIPEEDKADINVTASGSTVALGLMYLKSERQDIAGLLEIPTSVPELQLVRPDIILARTLSRSLILWEEIKATDEWVNSVVPEFLRGLVVQKKDIRQINNQNEELAFFNVVAGACFAIGLKYAGTARSSVHALLLRYYDFFWMLSHVSVTSYKHRIRLTAARSCLGVVAISLASVMSGTGELSVLSRLRLAHGSLDRDSNYGFHSAMHMALGLLFLGGGKHTLGSSNQAIAAMVCAFFPHFNISENENRSYPQPFRHLWALAVEPRCFSAQDIDTNESVYLPIKVKIREDGIIGSHHLVSPTLLPPMDHLVSLKAQSPRYWPVNLGLGESPNLSCWGNHSGVPVKRRAGFLSYAEDPKGNQSIFVVAGLTSALPDLGSVINCISSGTKFGGVEANVSSFVNNMFLRSFVRLFCSTSSRNSSSFVGLCQAGFIETLVKDYPQLILVHLQIHQLAQANRYAPFLQIHLRDLETAAKHIDFFLAKFQSSGRQTLVRSSSLREALQHLHRSTLKAKAEVSLQTKLGAYFRGQTLHMSTELALYLNTMQVPPLGSLRVLMNLFSGTSWDSSVADSDGGDPACQKARIQTQIGLELVMKQTLQDLPGHSEWNEGSRQEVMRLWRENL